MYANDLDITPGLVERFWSSCEPIPYAGCWIWKGSTSSDGYGQFHVGKNKYVRAHRLAFRIDRCHLDEELLVCHSCDTPRCVNPAHLWQGTMQDNHDDREAKGHTARGETGGMTKLTQVQVLQIRQLLAAGHTQENIAASFDVTDGSISNIKTGRTWSHI